MTDVIRRKIDRARQAQADGAPGADRGWRLALARAARDAMGLDLAVQKLTVTRASLAEIIEIAPDRSLVALLDGPAAGIGVVLLSPSVTSALIEMQAMGRLSSQAPPARKATRIDAAMVAAVIDRALAGLEESLMEEADLTWAGGFRYGSFLDDIRPLPLLLEEEVYRVLSADVILGDAGRTGQIVLILPAIGRAERPVIEGEDDGEDAQHFNRALATQVMQTDCLLDAVIGRVRLPLGRVMSLEIGEVLDLPLAGLDMIALETLQGRRLARARLGQNRGMRALKLTEVEMSRGHAPTSSLMPTPRPMPTAVAPEPEQELRATG
jgi:flagellar motor switch protein FliM